MVVPGSIPKIIFSFFIVAINSPFEIFISMILRLIEAFTLISPLLVPNSLKHFLHLHNLHFAKRFQFIHINIFQIAGNNIACRF